MSEWGVVKTMTCGYLGIGGWNHGHSGYQNLLHSHTVPRSWIYRLRANTRCTPKTKLLWRAINFLTLSRGCDLRSCPGLPTCRPYRGWIWCIDVLITSSFYFLLPSLSLSHSLSHRFRFLSLSKGSLLNGGSMNE